MIRRTAHDEACRPRSFLRALSFEEAIRIEELWDELRSYCRALGRDAGGDDDDLAYEIRTLLDQLETAGGLDAR
jgi:hypothetical protein